MAAASAVLLVTAALLCASAYALDQDGLREMIAASRTDVIDAHAATALPEPVPGEPTSETDGWLRKQLRLFPDSDLNGDGILTRSEARTWFLLRLYPFAPDGHELDSLPDGVSQWKVDLPMSTGGTLATEVYLPRGGGPWPVVLTRSSRGRMDSALDFGVHLLAGGQFAFVGQDRTSPDTREQRDSQADGRDTIEWIGTQPWCNGKVGMFGYSEAGITSKNAYVMNPPHMALCMAAISSLTRDPRDGVAGGRGSRRSPGGGWTPPEAIAEPYHSPFEGLGDVISIPLNDKTGWFDMFTQGAIDEWVEMRKNGRSILIMGSGAHGGLAALASGEGLVPPIYSDCDVLWDEMPAFRWLTGEVEPDEVRSIMYYFLMGDCLDPEAPGNVWKQTEVWPVPCEPTALYLTGQGGLERPAPRAPDASLSYTYDPADPVQAIACYNAGMLDQRPLAERKDILRFETPPLEQPVEITGRPKVQLQVSSDAPDTMFTATLVDVYPDGYEAILLEGAALARFHAGFDNPQPLEAGKVYPVEIEFISTAYVFTPGHKVRLHVSSSGAPRFTVHPNTWDAIASYDQAQVARNTVHCSAAHASRLMLPVIAPGVSVNYVPGARQKAARRAIADAAPAQGLPAGWASAEHTVRYAAPEGDGEKAVTFYTNGLKVTGPREKLMEFVRIPAGTVEIGEEGSPGRRVVELAAPVYMAAYDVTEAQYAEVMGANPSRFLGPDLPVQCVSPQDAEEFCRRLSERDGVRYRLPRDGEWEYACRAGATTQFWWGERARNDTAWWGPHMGGRPQPVGLKLANRFGLFDMAGNVREWARCEPKAESQGSMRMGYCLVGGPYYEGDWSMAGNVRIDYPDRYTDYNQCGFRVVVDKE
jgi:predicted acyl esterase/formylglycine-generating enzyme required for sulfatase activity